MNIHHSLGRIGEQLAEEYLKSQGYIILKRNYRVRFGEIDLVAQDGECICFVEVKTRRLCDAPQEAVSRRKQYKLTRLAQSYLKENFDSVDVRSRFDVVAIEEQEGFEARIELIQNAFDASA